jgi:hypothetical protein
MIFPHKKESREASPKNAFFAPPDRAGYHHDLLDLKFYIHLIKYEDPEKSAFSHFMFIAGSRLVEAAVIIMINYSFLCRVGKNECVFLANAVLVVPQCLFGRECACGNHE